MKFCTHCGNELADEAVVCPKCGCAVADSPYNKPAETSASYSTLSIVGFIMSFFMSIVGLIVSIVAFNDAKNKGDEKSKGFAKAGIIISAVSMGLAVLLVIFYFWFVFAIIGATAPYLAVPLSLI